MIKQIHFKSRGSDVWGFAHFANGMQPKPAIIMCHGFTGDLVESGRLFVEFAQKANHEGYHVFRYDFVGSGSSPEDFAENTFLGGWIKDIQNAIDFVCKHKSVDKSYVYLVGLSFGGAASLLAGKSKRVAAVVGWSPVIRLEETFRGIFGLANWQLLESGKEIADCYGDTAYRANPHFLTDLRQHDIPKAIEQYDGKPFLIVQGTEDSVVNPAHAQNLVRDFRTTGSLQMIEGADHVFNFKRNLLYTATLKFLKNVQKSKSTNDGGIV